MTRRLILAILAGVLWLASPVQAAVAYTASASAQDITGLVTTLTVGSVACTGSDPLCIVYASWRDNGETVSGVQCNSGGVTLTRVPNFPKAAIASGVAIDAFYTHTTFTATCVITWGSAPFRVYGSTLAFTGAHQTVEFDDDDRQDNNAGLTGTTDLTLTTQADGMVVDCVHIRADENLVADGSQTERTQQNGLALDTHGTSTLAASGTSTTVGWTWTTGANFQHAAIAIAPSAGAAPSLRPLMLLLGVGEAP